MKKTRVVFLLLSFCMTLSLVFKDSNGLQSQRIRGRLSFFPLRRREYNDGPMPAYRKIKGPSWNRVTPYKISSLTSLPLQRETREDVLRRHEMSNELKMNEYETTNYEFERNQNGKKTNEFGKNEFGKNEFGKNENGKKTNEGENDEEGFDEISLTDFEGNPLRVEDFHPSEEFEYDDSSNSHLSQSSESSEPNSGPLVPNKHFSKTELKTMGDNSDKNLKDEEEEEEIKDKDKETKRHNRPLVPLKESSWRQPISGPSLSKQPTQSFLRPYSHFNHFNSEAQRYYQGSAPGTSDFRPSKLPEQRHPPYFSPYSYERLRSQSSHESETERENEEEDEEDNFFDTFDAFDDPTQNSRLSKKDFQDSFFLQRTSSSPPFIPMYKVIEVHKRRRQDRESIRESFYPKQSNSTNSSMIVSKNDSDSKSSLESIGPLESKTLDEKDETSKKVQGFFFIPPDFYNLPGSEGDFESLKIRSKRQLDTDSNTLESRARVFTSSSPFWRDGNIENDFFFETPSVIRLQRKPFNKDISSTYLVESSSFERDSFTTNDILGSGNFQILAGGTFYEPNMYYELGNSEYTLRNSEHFKNFRDFEDIKNDLGRYR